MMKVKVEITFGVGSNYAHLYAMNQMQARYGEDLDTYMLTEDGLKIVVINRLDVSPKELMAEAEQAGRVG